MKKILSGRLPLMCGLLLVCLGVASTAFWFLKVDVGSWGSEHFHDALPAIGVLGILTSANLGLRWFRWHFLMRKLDILLPAKQSLKVYLVTLPAIATPFYLGELARPALVAGKQSSVWRACVAAWVLERSADVFVLLSFVLLARRVFFLFFAVVGLAVLLCYAGRWLSRHSSVSHLLRPRVLGVTLGASLFAWVLVAFGLWLVLHSFGAGVSGSTAAECSSLPTLLGGATGLPIGIGVTGSSAIALLERHGVVTDKAVLSIAVFRVGTTWYAMVLGITAMTLWGRQIVALLRRRPAVDHFDDVASDYERQIPDHVRRRLVTRKTEATLRFLPEEMKAAGARGLDLGCGQGWYASELARMGYCMNGCDLSEKQIEHARSFAAKEGVSVDFTVADAARLPYGDESFDFAYAVNMVHHLTVLETREQVLREVARVLKPGGVFILHEINVENPLFRFYMGYVFPLIRDIDEGTELWVWPSWLPKVPGCRWVGGVSYLTFMPDFVPRFLVRPLSALERTLECSPLRKWSAHYAACLLKEEVAGHPAGSDTPS
jgi:ubiquinone/menaquinone biosynthesis C-methylase UbiE